jgi:hypothetical protein
MAISYYQSKIENNKYSFLPDQISFEIDILDNQILEGFQKIKSEFFFMIYNKKDSQTILDILSDSDTHKKD